MVEGRKLIGSAQWRERGALLQHGSILLHNDQATVEDLRTGGPPGLQVPAAGLAEILDPLPDLDTIARALAASFSEEFELLTIRADLEPAETAAAETGRRKYEDEAWTWRR
jgi:lipoate-protein ligase A